MEGASLSPDEAFAVLGNETRMETLRALGDADKPLPFEARFTFAVGDDELTLTVDGSLDVVGVTRSRETT